MPLPSCEPVLHMLAMTTTGAKSCFTIAGPTGKVQVAAVCLFCYSPVILACRQRNHVLVDACVPHMDPVRVCYHLLSTCHTTSQRYGIELP